VPHINKEKDEQQKGNNHVKNTEHQHIIPSDGRPEAEVNEFLHRERPAQFERYSSSVEFLFEAGDKGEHATPYNGTAA
jgi:hypothetical protein